jgi:hypothetical protein
MIVNIYKLSSELPQNSIVDNELWKTLAQVAVWLEGALSELSEPEPQCACGCGETDNLTKGAGYDGDIYLCPQATYEANHPKM